VTTSAPAGSVAGLAFDCLAERYDSVFTLSRIGRAQRDVVWKRAAATFRRGSHVLELNCGTGEDAIYLATLGVNVTACDASARMIDLARAKETKKSSEARIEFLHLSTERLTELPGHACFDGVFSNFSGLNCIGDLAAVAAQLAERLRPGAPLLLCLSTRFCLWEVLHYLSKGHLGKALRRWRGLSYASVGQVTFPVYYPTLPSLRGFFAPEFHLRSVTGVGITVPPSYLEPWVARHPRLLQLLERIDEIIRTWPVVRIMGDHMLLHLEKR
jgi:ubiquinone/menaquinone biosynthesis C-methylase UbiE